MALVIYRKFYPLVNNFNPATERSDGMWNPDPVFGSIEVSPEEYDKQKQINTKYDGYANDIDNSMNGKGYFNATDTYLKRMADMYYLGDYKVFDTNHDKEIDIPLDNRYFDFRYGIITKLTNGEGGGVVLPYTKYTDKRYIEENIWANDSSTPPPVSEWFNYNPFPHYKYKGWEDAFYNLKDPFKEVTSHQLYINRIGLQATPFDASTINEPIGNIRMGSSGLIYKDIIDGESIKMSNTDIDNALGSKYDVAVIDLYYISRPVTINFVFKLKSDVGINMSDSLFDEPRIVNNGEVLFESSTVQSKYLSKGLNVSFETGKFSHVSDGWLDRLRIYLSGFDLQPYSGDDLYKLTKYYMLDEDKTVEINLTLQNHDVPLIDIVMENINNVVHSIFGFAGDTINAIIKLTNALDKVRVTADIMEYNLPLFLKYKIELNKVADSDASKDEKLKKSFNLLREYVGDIKSQSDEYEKQKAEAINKVISAANDFVNSLIELLNKEISGLGDIVLKYFIPDDFAEAIAHSKKVSTKFKNNIRNNMKAFMDNLVANVKVGETEAEKLKAALDRVAGDHNSIYYHYALNPSTN